jgi:hypothetical protein
MQVLNAVAQVRKQTYYRNICHKYQVKMCVEDYHQDNSNPKPEFDNKAFK